MPLEEFLEWRKRFYEAKYRLSHYPLPDDAIIEDGEVKEIANSTAETFWLNARDPTSEDMGVPIQTELEREEIARNLEEIEEELARLNIDQHEVSGQVEALDDEKDDAIHSGAVLSPTTEKRTTGERRRPRRPVPWVLVLGYTGMALT